MAALRWAIAVAASISAAGAFQPAQAQTYPTRPVTIVSAQAPGGASDTLARVIGERLQAALGQPIVIDSRPGAGGNVGAAFAARAPADGHTLLIGTDAMMTSNVHLFRSMAFDPVQDFAPITNAGANIITLAVNSAVPANSAAELIAYAKSRPGSLKFGSSGIASPHHLAGELLKQKTGIDIVHVPYRGGALSANDLRRRSYRDGVSQLFVGGAACPDWQDRELSRLSKGPAIPRCRTFPLWRRPSPVSKCRPGLVLRARGSAWRRSLRVLTGSSCRSCRSRP